MLRVDIMPTTGHSAMKEDTARHVLFSPDTSGHIAVLTKRGHLLKYSAQSGQLLSHKVSDLFLLTLNWSTLLAAGTSAPAWRLLSNGCQ